jgi:hypothetical protein
VGVFSEKKEKERGKKIKEERKRNRPQFFN